MAYASPRRMDEAWRKLCREAEKIEEFARTANVTELEGLSMGEGDSGEVMEEASQAERWDGHGNGMEEDGRRESARMQSSAELWRTSRGRRRHGSGYEMSGSAVGNEESQEVRRGQSWVRVEEAKVRGKGSK